ncbi:hypothetical protein M406DRAFT_325187 [Cryphonectria parasitica EP155]|uniref:Uncharacterized protein n=1 Tax=Cryphonectria parasitica (strain ATCC 38755 / EP155) TaxID=660469 RepID=A0A9P4YBM4_CRYP1|nr:uncharacterized protein M406DRAFT_325187 [Cryphonectria parasitica EP155]KAF3769695.1 hypothetical protein M406DRAFT_325187 [Cryphonectria parasitica EP155]
MKYSTITIAALAAGVNAFIPGLMPTTTTGPHKRDDSWGGAVSLGPSKSTIVHAVTTLTPGTAPSTQNGELFLWPGMSNGTGDLIQTTLESWPDNSWCGATTGQWCVRASVFGYFGQYDGTASAVSGDTPVEIVYSLSGTVWTQTVTNADTGAALSSYEIDVGSGATMTGYGTGTECDDSCSGTIAAQTYTGTTITLAAADESFGDTIVTTGGATYTGLATADGGVTWTIEEMYVPAMD